MSSENTTNHQASDTAMVFGTSIPGTAYFPRRAAYVVICDGGQFLAVRGAAGYFLPGGGCEEGESFESCVRREVAEEAAIEVRDLTYVGMATQFFYAASDEVHYEAQFAFFSGKVGRALGSKPEHAMHWMPIDVPSDKLYHESHVWAIRQVSASIDHDNPTID